MTKTKLDERLLELRARNWPEAEGEIFDPDSSDKGKGYSRIPRTVPMVAGLIDRLDKRSAGRLYITLWAHDRGHGVVDVKDPEALIFEAGYANRTRAHRNWLERMQLLVSSGFVWTKPVGTRVHGLVLLRDPHKVVGEMARTGHDKLDATWFATWLNAFTHRCLEIGIDLKHYEGLT